MQIELLHGDCLEVLRDLPDNSVDSLVTDPPAGIGFMGRDWDRDKGGRDNWVAWMTEVMRECHRVLKPGAHGLVWAIPRTSHWTGLALEQAGFEVRDQIYHLFGSGFPKSMSISLAIDKAAGAERQRIRPLGSVARRVTEGTNALGGHWQDDPWVTAPATPEAKQWEGWGTALKPSVECWWLVRKPISEKTVAANVLKWGTGGLAIDACRIATKDDLGGGTYSGTGTGTGTQVPGNNLSKSDFKQPIGRFPSHLVLSCAPTCTDDGHDMHDCPIAGIDAMSGETKSPSKPVKQGGHHRHDVGLKGQSRDGLGVGYADQGGASRYFMRFMYAPKPSRAERNAGLDTTPTKVNDGRQAPIDNPFQRGETPRMNTHPTVKATKLMAYLIRLVTPPGGVVLDPFMGSGSTGIAAKREGMRFIGIEQDSSYLEIATKRIAHVEHVT